jgi:phospholipid/cholesterol/gamma-HCH transport system substrate-binding protein
MAQRRSLAWTELRVGLLVIASFVILIMVIVYMGQQAGVGFFTKKYTITAYFSSANGLRKGSEVWLEGVTIGNVSDVHISKEPQPDPNRLIEVVMSLDENYKDKIRTGCNEEQTKKKQCSIAIIGNLSLLGEKNVEISRGTAGDVVQDNGFIQGTEKGDIKQIIESSDELVANLNDLSSTILDMSKDIKNGKGTLGKLLNDTSIYDNLNRATLEANALVRDAHTGKGTVGRLISDDDLYQQVKASIDKVSATLDEVNKTVVEVRQGNGTIAKLINDPSLYNQFKQMGERTQSILDRIDRGEGTLGKLTKDDALYNELRQTNTRVQSLISAIESGEGTTGRLIKDPALFNSLNGASSEVQKLLFDIRQNPKKFLTITLRLF